MTEDAITVLNRLRGAYPSGIGQMAQHELVYQMGGSKKRGDPYGWREQRVISAIAELVSAGVLEKDYCGRYCVVDAWRTPRPDEPKAAKQLELHV